MSVQLTEYEKEYIKHNILDPMQTDMKRVLLFETVDRAQTMLSSSIRRLKFDHENYEARSVIKRLEEKVYSATVEARKKGCDEIYSFELPFTIP